MGVYEAVNIPLWRAVRGLTGKRVLDLGCGTGSFGELVRRQGNVVDGVTFSPAEAEIARSRLDRVVLADLNAAGPRECGVAGPYDALVCGDVLEHLLDPVAVLGRFLPELAAGGRVYVSLPNVACFYVRFGLLFGRFDREPEGILDATHVHLPTRKAARGLLHAAGLRVLRTDFMPGVSVWLYRTFLKRTLPAGAVPRTADRADFRFYERYLFGPERFLTAWWPTFFANQFVFVCDRAG